MTPFSISRIAVNSWPRKVQDRKKGGESALWYRWILSCGSIPHHCLPPSWSSWLTLLQMVHQAGRQFTALCWATRRFPGWWTERHKANEGKAYFTCSVWMGISPFLFMIRVVQRTSTSSLTLAFVNILHAVLQSLRAGPGLCFNHLKYPSPVCWPTVQGWLSHCPCFSTSYTVIDLIIY